MKKDSSVQLLTSMMDHLVVEPKKNASESVAQELLDKTSIPQVSIIDFKTLIEDFLHGMTLASKGNNPQLLQSLEAKYARIKYLHNNPLQIKDAAKDGGAREFYRRYEPALLKNSITLNNLKRVAEKMSPQLKEITIEEAELVARGFNSLVRHHKFNLTYCRLATGIKFKKTGTVKLSPVKKVKPTNPIAEISKANIARLKSALNEKNNNPYGLRDDELPLLKLLLQLPLRCQHATNFYYPIANAGSLDSYTEIQRHRPDFESAFSTKGNVTKLGNGGFVFFRIFVEGVNGSDSRYGNTRLVTDISVLEQHGWISLHDQLIPFPHKGTSKNFYWDKRILRTGKPSNLNSKTKTNADRDGIEYTYRQEKLPTGGRYKGKKDSLKTFREKMNKTTRTLSFTDEIFYGKDILLGIALSVIYELRCLANCGFREDFLKFMNSEENSTRKIKHLGLLLKGLFRVEGKYPVSLQLLSQQDTSSVAFFPYVNPSKDEVGHPVVVENPSGDHRFSPDLTVNVEDMKHALLNQELKYVSDKIAVFKKQRGRYLKDTEDYNKNDTLVIALEARLVSVNKELATYQENMSFYVEHFQSEFNVDQEDIIQMGLTKLALIHEFFEEFMQNDTIAFNDFARVSAITLDGLSHEFFLELLGDEYASFDELFNLSLAEIQAFSDCDNFMRIFSEHDKTFAEFVQLYREDPLHLICLTAYDLSDLVLEYAPDIPALLEEYAIEHDVDFGDIRSELCESDQMLFDSRFPDTDDQDDPEEIADFDEDPGWIEPQRG
jgi:hypothetical protein